MSTLSWMWKHARVEVKGKCEQYRLDKRIDLPPAEPTLIPAVPKTTDLPLEQVGPMMVNAHKVNTSQFPYMPQQENHNDAWNMGEHMLGSFENNEEKEKQWLEMPMGMEDEDDDEHEDRGRWHGVRFLGVSALGFCNERALCSSLSTFWRRRLSH